MKKSFLDNKYIHCIILVFTFTFTFGLFAPLDLYVGNINDFWFDLYDIFPEILKFFGMAFGAMLILGLLVTRFFPRISHVLFIFFFTLLVILYLQGNYLVVDMGKMDGEALPWDEHYLEAIIHIVVYVAIATIFILLRVKFKYQKISKAYTIVNLCILGMEMVTLLTSMTMYHALDSKVEYVSTEANTKSYSTTQNFNIVMLDTYDIRVLDKVMEEHPELCQKVFKDFTYYADNAGRFTLTDFAVPQIITGDMYLNQCEYGEFINEAYEKSPLLNQLLDDDWNVNVYTTVTLPQNEFAKKISCWEKIDFAPKSNATITNFYRLLAFRYAPQFARPFFEFDMDDFDDDKDMYTVNGETDFDDSIKEYSWRNLHFYKRINGMKADTDEKMFHFYHMKGIHAVRELTADMKITKDELSLEESGYVMVKILGEYLDRLKKIGAYDNSIIMIMADHGSHKIEGGKIHSPILLIKGYDEKHDMSINKAPVSYEDLNECYKRLLNGEQSDAVFDVKEGDERTRYFYYTTFDGALKMHSKNDEFVEYKIEGSIYDYDKIEKTGVVYE
ncbi:MAG: hypothetical protein MJZ11_11375 [Lachnospiraceae bacterium]|nr:hypothetical protein [Lachnospiraceae bacterium]